MSTCPPPTQEVLKMFERLTESNSRDPYKDPPLTREDFERAEAVIRKFARHFAGTEHGRAFAACAVYSQSSTLTRGATWQGNEAICFAT